MSAARRQISISILTLFDTFLSKELDLLDGWAIDLRLVAFHVIVRFFLDGWAMNLRLVAFHVIIPLRERCALNMDVRVFDASSTVYVPK